MTIASGLLPTAAPPAPWRAGSWRKVSPPSPWYARSAAERTVAGLAPRVAVRAARLQAAMLRSPAHNAVAAERLFAALAGALAPDVPVRRHPGRRHAVLTAWALAPAAPYGAAAWEAPGLGVEVLLCLAGKRLDLRSVARPLVATLHACARFAERSGLRDPAALQAAMLEAAGHVPAVIAAHCDGGLAPRLRGGTAPILLPAGEGAFLGHLRLHAAPAGARPVPAIEASTWVHASMLDTPQVQARDVLLAGLPAEELVRALPEAWAGLHGSVSGDRRVLAGLPTVPLDVPAAARTALRGCPTVAGARLLLGIACADGLAAEMTGPH